MVNEQKSISNGVRAVDDFKSYSNSMLKVLNQGEYDAMMHWPIMEVQYTQKHLFQFVLKNNSSSFQFQRCFGKMKIGQNHKQVVKSLHPNTHCTNSKTWNRS